MKVRSVTAIPALSALLLMAMACTAQQGPNPLTPGCGADDIHFHVDHGAPAKNPTKGDPTQAKVYVIEVFDAPPGTFGVPTIRVGVDGKWVGANQGATYLEVPVSAGEHHLCARWQSHLSSLSKLLALYNFSAQSNQAYYFQILIEYQTGVSGAAKPYLKLQSLSSDEGKYLVANAEPSISKPEL